MSQNHHVPDINCTSLKYYVLAFIQMIKHQIVIHTKLKSPWAVYLKKLSTLHLNASYSRAKGRNPSSPICKHYHLHSYDWKHIYGCITTVFIKYNDTRFRWTILTYPHNFQGSAFFQYNLNSRFSICNRGHPADYLERKNYENHFVY